MSSSTGREGFLEEEDGGVDDLPMTPLAWPERLGRGRLAMGPRLPAWVLP